VLLDADSWQIQLLTVLQQLLFSTAMHALYDHEFCSDSRSDGAKGIALSSTNNHMTAA
jgi:hypothetical protein